MPDILCGKQTKLSKTMGSQLDTMGEIISSRCPILKLGIPSFCLINCLFPCFFHPLPPAEEGNMQSDSDFLLKSATQLHFGISVIFFEFPCILYGGRITFFLLLGLSNCIEAHE